MTDRERMLATIRGEAPDRLPFVPRLEFWHRAKKRNNTLPADVAELSLIEIADQLGVGYYSVVPDFTACAGDLDMIDYALGLPRLPSLLYETSLEEVERRVLSRGRETVVEYHTPMGCIRTATVLTDEMLEAGVSAPWRTEHAIQKLEDFDVVGFIFSHLKVESKIERYHDQVAAMGGRGLVIAWLGGSGGPMQHMMKELMPVEQFFYALNDYPAKVHRLAEQMQPYYSRLQEIGVASGAEAVMLGGNYDDAITYPPFFHKHILPLLANYARTLHAKGKYLMTHTDGENRKLIPLYLESGFDIADSVCPHPMTSMPLDEMLEVFSGRITIMGGIPSVMLCASSASEERFRRFIDTLVDRYARHPRLILGVSDMVTADAEWDRLRYIIDRLGSVA